MKKFQKDFMLGAATAAHQVEGNNINSDYWVQEQIPHSSFDEPSLDAVDHYNRYEEDIRLLAEAGLNTYRFSIEWARIQPEPDMWLEEEVEHYRKVIRCCKANGVTPIVTMHHFTSPKWLITQGGWENPEVVDKFAAYCKRLVEEIGDELEYVCTINEANMRLQLAALIKDMMKRMMGGNAGQAAQSDVQVGINMMPENIKLGMVEAAEAFKIADPTKIHTFVSQCTPEGDILVMKAHEAARDAMKASCPHLKIGLTLSLHDMQPFEGGEQNAAKEWDEEFLHYLPYIKNDDFLGVQCYSRKRFDANGVVQPADDAPRTQMGYEDYPMGIVNVVRKVAQEFNGTLIVTENGIATDNDARRCEFIKEAIEGIQACIEEGIPVKGYMYWTLLDNFEWQKGYSMTFGLIAVDRTTQTRYPKESLKLLGSLVER
ncbi:MAG: glycoside hydrolase family 1 protein [Candidatus Galacturonibacter soehngenii]|nr:glycoside hydrolase family 1 protein [Candidatus Galacturonibacter soehngenii]